MSTLCSLTHWKTDKRFFALHNPLTFNVIIFNLSISKRIKCKYMYRQRIGYHWPISLTIEYEHQSP